jgi:hypothetical protein
MTTPEGHGIGLPQDLPPVPAPKPRPWWRRPWGIVGIAAAVIVLAIIGASLPQDEQPSTEPTAGASSPFDRATFDAWWSSDAVPESVRAVVTSVGWNGVALAAETTIVDDADAPAAAQAVCSALSAFWLDAGGGFRPVQVLGTDGGPLASRGSLADDCVGTD